MVVVADSSPLRYLIVLGEQDLLPELLGEIWIPSAVLEELSASATPASVCAFLHSPPGWLKVCDPENETLEGITDQLDRGERAALALARELGADLVLLDYAAASASAADELSVNRNLYPYSHRRPVTNRPQTAMPSDRATSPAFRLSRWLHHM